MYFQNEEMYLRDKVVSYEDNHRYGAVCMAVWPLQ
jgi:hypothetical protein